jgi:hypothetical protein
MNNNDQTWWKNAIAGNVAPIDVNTPQYGFYRSKKKDGSVVPVAFWYDDGTLNCLVDGKEIDEHRGREIWPYVSRRPVTYAVYEERINTGKWSDIDPVVHEQQQAAQIGHNNPPTDPHELLKEQIESAKAGAAVYAIIGSDELAAKAQTLRSRLLELSGAADKHRETEKKPHLTAGKLIDEKWGALIKSARGIADGIRASMETWETKKLQARRAEEAKAAAVEVERQAEIAKGKTPPPPVVQPPPAPSNQIKGAAGRTASVRPKIAVTGISDVDALFGYFKRRRDLEQFLIGLAQTEFDLGVRDIPGVIVEERAKVV